MEANKPTITDQELFDRVATHLLKQGKRSEEYGRCLYRRPDGLKCAVGCLIPDDAYDQSMEGAAIFNVVRVFDFRPNFIQIEQLMSLQGIHDSTEPQDWPAHLKRFAQKYNLNDRVVSTIQPCAASTPSQ